jgi:hypothetical protein
MPIANAINQASTSVTQLKARPHIGAPNAPGCALRSGTQTALPPPADNQFGSNVANRGQRRVRNNKDSRRLSKTRPFPQNGSVFELIALGASFRDPYPAFSAAIRVLFTVAGAGRNGAR